MDKLLQIDLNYRLLELARDSFIITMSFLNNSVYVQVYADANILCIC